MTLAQYISKYKPSSPVFNIEAGSRWGEAYISLHKPFVAFTPNDPIDPVDLLVAECIEERFSSKELEFEICTSDTLSQVRRSISRHFLNFIKRGSPASKPKQTKLYKFWSKNYLQVLQEENVEKIAIQLYKFIVSSSNVYIKGSPENKAVLAILEKVRESHES